VVLERPDGDERVVTLRAQASTEDLGPLDLVIVLTKAYATANAARMLAGAVSPGTWVVTLQNGIGNDRALAAVLGPERVVAGTTTVGAEQPRPGATRVAPSTASGDTVTYLGAPCGDADGGVAEVAEVLTDAGLPTVVLPSAGEAVWTKVALAAPMASISAILGWTVSGVYENPSTRTLLRELFDEIVAVARATSVSLDPATVWGYCEHTWQTVGPHMTSMAVDVRHGRRTEIDALNLEVARLGDEVGVPAPANRAVGLLVAALAPGLPASRAPDTLPNGR
jgi:2-dehydropantoate 2-reductase